jgi:hypothetical protein
MNNNIYKLVSMVVLAAILSGCIPGGLKPQKGGSASVNKPEQAPKGIIVPGKDHFSPPSATLEQPQNPNSTSSQGVSYEMEEVVITPYDVIKETITQYGDDRIVTVRETIPAGTKTIRKAKSNVNQEIGGSWKDTTREIGAALASFKGVQYAGIAVLLFAAYSFFNLPVRTLIGGKDVSMALGGCGAVMMFGPFILVTYANYFFLAILAVGAYWVLARLKYKEGKLDAIEPSKQ